MAHKQQMEFCSSVKDRFPNYFTDSNVLEIGSKNINGSVRQFFEAKSYTGIDLSEGPDVNIVCHAKDFQGENYDVVISCEALEHDRFWKETLIAAYRMLKPGGLLVITCGGAGRQEHGTTRTSPQDSPDTTDYYRNITTRELMQELCSVGGFDECELRIGKETCDSYFWGIK